MPPALGILGDLLFNGRPLGMDAVLFAAVFVAALAAIAASAVFRCVDAERPAVEEQIAEDPEAGGTDDEADGCPFACSHRPKPSRRM